MTGMISVSGLKKHRKNGSLQLKYCVRTIGEKTMQLNPDFLEFIRLLNIHKVRYLVVGAFARSFYGHPRYTGDINIFLALSKDNAEKVMAVLKDFGLDSLGLTGNDFLKADQTIQLGTAPRRIDILTGITAVDFETAWKNKKTHKDNGTKIFFISKEDYIINKKALGRHKDLADIEAIDES